MKNVYDEIQALYDEYEEFDLVLEQSIVERYLRKKAWQGLDDEALRDVWSGLNSLFQYLNFVDVYHLNELTKQEYIRMISWMDENSKEFYLSEATVRVFFDHMIDFNQYLYQKKIIFNLDAVQTAQAAFFPEGGFTLPALVPEETLLLESLGSQDLVSDETADKLNLLLERLLNKIGLYYKSEEFSFDFNRAISLYSGPFNAIPEEEGEDFWLGFWDYFLFDYHLVDNDLTPLRYFYESKKENLSMDEIHVLNDLLQAKFTIFYIHRIVNQYVVECVNLMTNEKIQLPIPDYGMHDYKKVLLYGHIYSEGIVMLNYITSVQVSPKLRQRIKEEILRQQVLFKLQQQDSDLVEFFDRHAILVRHTIDILVHLAKVNVGLPILSEPTVSQPQLTVIPEDAVVFQLRKLAGKHRFGLFTTGLLLRMWRDFLSVKPDLPQDKYVANVSAAAVFLSFSTINGMKFVRRKNVLQKLGTTEPEVNQLCNQIVTLLCLRLFDPRYLTEEGFVLSLYAF